MKGKIFNAQEVQAIIAGNKTQFREVIMPQPILSPDKSYWEFKNVRWAGENSSYAKKFGDIAKPEMPEFAKFQVGETIFVKEKFAEVEVGAGFGYNTGEQIIYRADDDYDEYWKPAQQMKQEQSRLTLRIKSVKVERLRDIKDCLKEGFSTDANYNPLLYLPKKKTALQKFIKNWNSTHKKQEHKWGANPWVFVYEFEVINN